MIQLGTKVSAGGVVGIVVAAFADGMWARKFMECPWCDSATWELRTEDADLSTDSGPQYLVDDVRSSRWHLIDGARLQPLRAIGGEQFKVGGSD